MEKLHIQKESYKGYCVGTGVEYPGIIVHGKTDGELINTFVKALPGHKKALSKIKNSGKAITVLEIDSPRMAK